MQRLPRNDSMSTQFFKQKQSNDNKEKPTKRDCIAYTIMFNLCGYSDLIVVHFYFLI